MKVEGAEKRKREAEKAEKTRAKKRLKDAKKTKKHTQKKIKQQGDGSLQATKRRILFGKIAKKLYELRKIIIISAAAITVVVCAIIFIPKVFSDIRQAEEEHYVAENKDELLALFEQIADQSLTKEELEEKAKAVSDKIKISYRGSKGSVRYDEDYTEMISCYINDRKDAGKYSGFYFIDQSGEESSIIIRKEDDGYIVSGDGQYYGPFSTAKEAVNKYVLSRESK